MFKKNKYFSACARGYYGSYCNTTCPTGTFGDKCAGVCFPNCSSETCHNVYGCLERSTAKTQVTSGKVVIISHGHNLHFLKENRTGWMISRLINLSVFSRRISPFYKSSNTGHKRLWRKLVIWKQPYMSHISKAWNSKPVE